MNKDKNERRTKKACKRFIVSAEVLNLNCDFKDCAARLDILISQTLIQIRLNKTANDGLSSPSKHVYRIYFKVCQGDLGEIPERLVNLKLKWN